jgi:hypothetical protein
MINAIPIIAAEIIRINNCFDKDIVLKIFYQSFASKRRNN